MKYLILIFISLVLIAVFWFKENSQPITSTPTPPPAISSTDSLSALDKMTEINFQDSTFRFAYFTVSDSENLHLFSNLPDSKKSTDLFIQNNCQFLINGGFYSEDNKPLGWLVSDSQEITKPLVSDLFDGFLFQNPQNQIFLNRQVSKNTVNWGLQTGPMLIENGNIIKLSIKNDKLARRSVAALNSDNQIIFITVTSNIALSNGPLLTDLPAIIKLIAQNLNQQFISAINLDGGTASAFITPEVQILEFSPIGSFFCLK